MTLAYETIRYKYCMSYYRHGVEHRIDGPSDIHDSGDMFWDQYGELHRMDGPALLTPNRKNAEYYIRGDFFTKTEYESKIRSS